jgi:surface protein
MKSINHYILEKLKISKNNIGYNYFPQTKQELKNLIEELIEERGNEGDFNDIDTSEIRDMSELFRGMNRFNGDISKWDVSNVTDMDRMFSYCEKFNRDISNWKVSKVVNKLCMFFYCEIEEKYKPKFNY